MISPADTSNELINLDDKGFFLEQHHQKLEGVEFWLILQKIEVLRV